MEFWRYSGLLDAVTIL